MKHRKKGKQEKLNKQQRFAKYRSLKERDYNDYIEPIEVQNFDKLQGETRKERQDHMLTNFKILDIQRWYCPVTTATS